MKSLSILAILLIVPLISAFTLRELRNDTLQQQNEAGFHARITNGQTAGRAQFPYQVGLRHHRPGVSFTCGGSLISTAWVLTAAHCTINAKTISVYVGTTELVAERSVESRDHIKEHDEFNGQSLHHDIALIKIRRIIRLSDVAFTVNLPWHDHSDYVDRTGKLAGWGYTSDSRKTYAHTLQYSKFRVISNDKCKKSFRDELIIYEGKMCTAAPNRISGCTGDSGGPLVLAEGNIQIGILSLAGISGCERGTPNAYTRVSSYLDWIRKNTEGEFS